MERQCRVLAYAVAVAGCVSPQHRQDVVAVQRSGAGEAIETKVARGWPLTLEEIVELNQKGAPDKIIIRAALARSRAVYKLNTADVQRLSRSGVSDAIIDFTLVSRVRYARAAYHPRYHYGYCDYRRYGSFRYRSYPYRYYHRRYRD